MSDPFFDAAPRGDEASFRPAERRALVVEDDAPIRALIRNVLRREGFAVDTAENGVEALRQMRERDYEVILLDLAMPVMNGVELIEDLQQRMPRALRRVVVMTASLHLLRHGLPADVCRVITKPFTIDQLRSAVFDCGPAPDR